LLNELIVDEFSLLQASQRAHQGEMGTGPQIWENWKNTDTGSLTLPRFRVHLRSIFVPQCKRANSRKFIIHVRYTETGAFRSVKRFSLAASKLPKTFYLHHFTKAGKETRPGRDSSDV
jgi:hypothetical protein